MFDIILAESAGFCMGVKNAFDKTLEIVKDYPQTVILGDIVHNRFAINEIEKSGLIVVENVDEILNDTEIKNVIIRAHGITLKTYKRLEDAGKKIFDLKNEGYDVYAPIMKYCTDNASMIGAEGYLQYKKGKFADLKLNARAVIPLEY